MSDPNDLLTQLQQQLAQEPANAEVWHALAVHLFTQGHNALAQDTIATAMILQPDNPAFHSSQIWIQDADAAQTPTERQRARLDWWLKHALPRRPAEPRYNNHLDPHRCLRIAYVVTAGDIEALTRLIAEHDAQQCRVFVYANCTASVPGAAVRNMAEQDDTAFVQQIVADQIDVLLDLSGHAPGNRLPVFAFRPAPVQVSFGTGTGMLEIQSLLQVGEPLPLAEQCIYAERVLRVPMFNASLLEGQYRQLWQRWCEWHSSPQVQNTFVSKLNQAVAAHQIHRVDEAEALYLALLNQQRDHADILNLLGLVYLANERRRNTVAVLLMARAVALAPQSAEYLSNLGMAYQDCKLFEAAEPCFTRACAMEPASIRLRLKYVNLLRECKRYTEALRLYDELLNESPDNPDLHYNRALTYWLDGQIHAALEGFVKTLALDQRYEDAHHAMVSLLEGEPDHAATLQAFRDTLAAHPFAPQLHSVLAYSSDFDSSLDAAGQQGVRKAYHAQQIVPQQIQPLPLKVVRDPERKLRIGFMPGRFYRNASVYAYLPILLQLDRAEFEVWCYDNFPLRDDFTAQIKARADGWRDITALSDAEAAQQIRDDKIDVLIDLFAHAGANRLPIYAYRPAPIQVTAWGHANGTGMDCMDYLFSDPVSIPPQETALYAEHVHYLPCQLSYWLPETAPDVAPFPLEQNGYITFGCFNRMIKVSDAVLDLWMDLLKAVPDSRLLLKAAELEEPAQRERIIGFFRRHDIPVSRLEMHIASPWFVHLQHYAAVDIALDPFPMGGGVTTLDTLWMGVPVVCLRGKTLGQRITSAIMTAVGLDDWVSDSVEGYKQLVLQKAADRASLARLRASLRMRMAASPLANPRYYVGCVEDALRAFWRQWCADPQSRLPQPTQAVFGVAEHAAEADRLWQDFLADPDSADVHHRLAEMMRKAGKPLLAAAFAPTTTS